MGIDYCGIGGIGIYFDDKFIEKAKATGIFKGFVITGDDGEDVIIDDEDCDSDNVCEYLEGIGMQFGSYGNTYSVAAKYVLFVDGNNLTEIIANAPKFIQNIKDKFGIDIVFDDLKVIREMLVH